MINITKTYTDFDGNSRTETYYFHLSMAELADMELTTVGGLGDRLKRLIEARDQAKLVTFFRDLVRKSYGEKTDDGRYFMKEDENGRPLWKRFISTPAYSDIYMDFVYDDVAAANFVNGILPSKEEQAKYAKMAEAQKAKMAQKAAVSGTSLPA